MFKRFSLFAVLLGTLALNSSHGAYAKDSATQAADRRAITTLYDTMDRAFVRKDTNAFMAHIAPDFQGYSQNHGVFDRDGFERVMLQMEAVDTRVIYSTTSIKKWQWRGPDAVVWLDSKARAQSPRGTLMSWGSSRHYWGKIGGRWLLRQDVTLAYKSLLNGKPLR